MVGRTLKMAVTVVAVIVAAVIVAEMIMFALILCHKMSKGLPIHKRQLIKQYLKPNRNKERMFVLEIRRAD